MSNELQHRHTATGSTIYAILRNQSGQCVVQADGSIETQVNANWGTYDIPLTETPASGYLYVGDMPGAVAGVYHGEVYLQAGGSPALTDTLIGTFGEFHWNGSAEVHPLPNAEPDAAGGLSALMNAEVLDVLNVDTLVAGVTMAEALRRIGAITSGVVTGAGTGSETFQDYEASANTIVVTVDASGNRSAIAYN